MCQASSHSACAVLNRLRDIARHNRSEGDDSRPQAQKELPAYVEVFLFYHCGVYRCAFINRLLMHWLPRRARLNFLAEHKDTKSLHVDIRLAIGSRRVHLMNNTGSTADCGLDYLLVCVLLSLDANLRI